jgi:hypothetical protein
MTVDQAEVVVQHKFAPTPISQNFDRPAPRVRLAYGGQDVEQDGKQASQNSTLQKSLAVKSRDHSGLATAKAEI